MPGVLLPHDVPAPAGRPVLDAGRLGLDRRPVRRPVPGLALGPAGPRPPRPQVRPGARPRPDGAPRRPQRLPAADRAQADPPGRVRGRALGPAPAVASPAAARRSARSCSTGAARRSASTINEFYGQTECNLVVSQQRRDRCPSGRARWAGRCPGHEVAIIDADGSVVPARRARRDRRPAPGPGDVPRLLEPARRRRREVHRRLAADGRPGRHGRRRLRLVPGPQRRRHHQRRLPDRAGRDRGLPAPPPGRRDGRGRRRPGSGSDGDRQGLRRAYRRGRCRRPS